MDLTDAQIERYSRQIILPALGGRGQQRLLESTAHVVGAGPLAAITAWYLTAAGIGVVELWTGTGVAVDLQALRQDLAALNPDTKVISRSLESAVEQRTDPPVARAVPSAPRTGHVRRTRNAGTCALHKGDQATAVLVCADVTATVLEQVNRIALQQRLPLLAAGGGVQPRIALYAGHEDAHPCAACDPQPPVREGEAAAADSTIGFIGSLLALEAIKAALGLPGFRSGIGLHYEPETLTISEWPIGKRATCRACAPARECET